MLFLEIVRNIKVELLSVYGTDRIIIYSKINPAMSRCQTKLLVAKKACLVVDIFDHKYPAVIHAGN